MVGGFRMKNNFLERKTDVRNICDREDVVSKWLPRRTSQGPGLMPSFIIWAGSVHNDKILKLKALSL